jgi:hypothetical protein
VLDVLAESQPNSLANFSKIKLVRGRTPTRGGYLPGSDNPDFRPDDAGSLAMIINLNKMMKSGDLSKNVQLQPDDIIYVPPTPLAWIGLQFQQLLFPVQPGLQTIQVPGALGAAVP